MSDGILRNSRLYLCGQVETAADCGSSWRKAIAHKLVDIEPTFTIWDPLIKPDWMTDDSKNNDVVFGKHRMFGKWYGTQLSDDEKEIGRRGWAAASEIRRVCKKLVATSDFVIARITKEFTWGSIDELEIAAEYNKPVFFWLPDGPIGLYGLPACVPNYGLIDDYVFYYEEDMLSYIKDLNEGRSDLLRRDPYAWLYLTYPSSTKE